MKLEDMPMKLLIVDDEELTRTGLLASVDWSAAGIDEVIQADDGLHGLEAARLHKPEIILCDVRMPRMTGIAMLEQLETFLPDCVPIFMSGYSDKEYLKAAIKLKAVNYIEKPLNPEEVQEAVTEACNRFLQKQRSRQGETLRSLNTASLLARQLTVPYKAHDPQIQGLAEELSIPLHSTTCFTSYIIRLGSTDGQASTVGDDICRQFQEFLSPFHLHSLYVEKHVNHLVYFVLGEECPSAFVFRQIREFLTTLCAAFPACIMVQGDTLTGVSKAFVSYNSAVILLQSSYFFLNHTFLTKETLPHSTGLETAMETPDISYRDCLEDKNQQACQAFLEKLHRQYFENTIYLPTHVKDVYYKLFLAMESLRRQLSLPDSAAPVSIAELIDSCFTYQDLHTALQDASERFFRDIQNPNEEHPTIYRIKEYIGRNYTNETLSVKDISSHVFLSSPYVCTLFKAETGQTLNQYLTGYRMERAKQLLCDSRYKITDISSKVGYSDGNYFGKSFKKYTGYSPSDYREKMIR